MCGILAICGGQKDLAQAQQLSARQAHRGPDCAGAYQNPSNASIVCHERLSIIDLSCTQPLQGSRPDIQIVHNGEIYNHEQLRKKELANYQFKTNCDSEVIVGLWEKFDGPNFCNLLDGVFGFALTDGNRFMVARDPVGIKALYYGIGADGTYYFASELKSIFDQCHLQLAAFPPGHYYTPESGFVRYYEPRWFDVRSATEAADLAVIHDALVSATTKRLMSDVPLGLLLSGGLDSSLISAIAVREMERLGGNRMISFAIGLDGNAPDMIAARKVADFLHTDHRQILFTVEEGLAAIEQVIWHLETYDPRIVRVGAPTFLLCKAIHNAGIKVVLSGEGADEVFGGYLYFRNAPSDEAFQQEMINRVQQISKIAVLRADKCSMAHAVEVRVPFLDRQFLDVAMAIKPEFKRTFGTPDQKIEKWILRKAFDNAADPYLPSEILWRPKEQFDNGVGYNWVDQIITFCTAQITNEQMACAEARFPIHTPETKEAYYVRTIFEKHFPGDLAANSVPPRVQGWPVVQGDMTGRACDAPLSTSNPHEQNKLGISVH